MRLISRLMIAAALILSGLSAFAAEPIAVQRWCITTTVSKSGQWTEGHAVVSTENSAAITFVGKSPVYRHQGKRQNIAVSNLSAGDAFHFTIPVSSLPKGTEVDFGITIGIENGGPTKWVCEYRCGKKWIKAGSLSVNWYKSGDDTEWVTNFTLAKEVKGELCVRVRTLAAAENPDASVYLLSIPQYAAYLAAWPAGKYDRKKVLCIGNSFTFFGSSYLALMEIARSQGHSLQIGVNTKGGQNFGQHLNLERSKIAIEMGNYDVALMQNQSMSGAYYDSDSVKYAYLKDDAIKIADMVRKSSPKVRLILERTWAYPTKSGNWKGYGSGEAMDAALQNGTEILAAAMDAEISPIGNAFIKGRELALPLYWGDSFHQNWLGAYLKACVNYLVIFGEPFNGYVTDYTVGEEQAEACRRIASETVLSR